MVDYHIVPAHTFICLDYHIEAVNHLYTTGSNCNVPSPGMCPSSSPSSTKGPELAIRRSWQRDWWAFSSIFVFFFGQRISPILVFFRENPRPRFGIFFDNIQWIWLEKYWFPNEVGNLFGSKCFSHRGWESFLVFFQRKSLTLVWNLFWQYAFTWKSFWK